MGLLPSLRFGKSHKRIFLASGLDSYRIAEKILSKRTNYVTFFFGFKGLER